MSDNKNTPENIESGIIPVDIEAEMKQSFIDYAMSVIVDRALPDIRDGLNRCIEEFFTQCIFPGLRRINLTENLLQPWVKQ